MESPKHTAEQQGFQLSARGGLDNIQTYSYNQTSSHESKRLRCGRRYRLDNQERPMSRNVDSLIDFLPGGLTKLSDPKTDIPRITKDRTLTRLGEAVLLGTRSQAGAIESIITNDASQSVVEKDLKLILELDLWSDEKPAIISLWFFIFL